MGIISKVPDLTTSNIDLRVSSVVNHFVPMSPLMNDVKTKIFHDLDRLVSPESLSARRFEVVGDDVLLSSELR